MHTVEKLLGRRLRDCVYTNECSWNGAPPPFMLYYAHALFLFSTVTNGTMTSGNDTLTVNCSSIPPPCGWNAMCVDDENGTWCLCDIGYWLNSTFDCEGKSSLSSYSASTLQYVA